MTGQERVTKVPPRIAGVDLGSDWLKKRSSIELQSLKGAQRRRSEFSESSLDLGIVKLEAISYFDLPILGRGDSDFIVPNAPRVDPITGSVWTSRWGPVTLEKGENGLKVRKPEEYVVFTGKAYDRNPRKVSLEAIPNSYKVMQFIPQEVWDGIESAMRQQDEIAHDHKEGGPEYKRIEDIYSQIYILTNTFLTKEKEYLDKEYFNGLSKKVESILQVNNLLSAKNSIWVKISDYTLRSAQKDSLNRTNPMISRILARAAFLNIVTRELINNEIGSKAESIYNYLGVVRSDIRSRFEQTADILDMMGGFDTFKGQRLLVGKDVIEDKRKFNELKNNIIKGLQSLCEEILSPIQPAPYLIPKELIIATLLGKARNRYGIDDAKKRLDVADLGTELNRTSVFECLIKNNFQDARERLRNAYTIAKSTLEDPETQDIKVFQ